VPLSEVLHTFLEDAGIETPDEYALEYNGTRIFDAEASPLSLGLDPFTEWPAAVLEVVEVGTRRIASSLLALNRLGTALAIARSGTAEQHAHLADADALAQVFGLLDLDDLLSVSKVCALWHVVSQRVSLLYQLQCSAPPTVEYPAYLSLLSELSTLLDADACRARAAEHSQWAILRLSKELSDGASGGGHSGGGHSGGRRNRSRGLRWDRPSMFTKAAGCTTMRTVEAALDHDELIRATLPLRSQQAGFLAGVRATRRPCCERRPRRRGGAGEAPDRVKSGGGAVLNIGRLRRGDTAEVDAAEAAIAHAAGAAAGRSSGGRPNLL
jgi:hypothetical protein